MKSIIAISAIAALLGAANAHSWVEEIQVISESGNYTGDYGYTRGYVARTDPAFTGDSMNYLLPPLASGRTRIDSTDLLCHPSQRTSSDYNNTAYPRLQVAAGSYIAMKYLENGHVTLPDNQKGKPKSGGPVFIYGTSSPSDSEKIADVLEWNRQGSGGDKRGTLLASDNFDDGRCHQINSGSISVQRQQEFPDRVAGQPTSTVEQWCESDVLIPTTYKVGDKVTLYWVWSWPTEPGADPIYPTGKDEYYTSCAEVEVVDKIDNGKPMHTLVQQDPQSTAVSDFKDRTAYTSSPLYTLAGTTGSASSGAMTYPTSASASVYSSSSPYVSAPSSSASVYSSVYSSAYSSPTAYSASAAPVYPSQSNLPSGSSSALPTIILPSANSTSGPSGSSASSFSYSMPAAPNTVTVTDFITLAQQQKNAIHTRTEFVTSYVTASPSLVIVSASSVIATPDASGNAGLIGAKFGVKSRY